MSLLGPNWEDMCRPTQTLHHPVEIHDSLGRLYPHTDSGVCGMWCMHVCMFTSTQELVGECTGYPLHHFCSTPLSLLKPGWSLQIECVCIRSGRQ